MLRAEMEKAVQDLYGARLSNDLEKARDCFSSDSRFAINGCPEASTIALNVSGKPTVDQLLADLFETWEWLEQDMDRVLIDGQRAAVHYRLKARFMPTGEIIDTKICDLLTFQSGKLTEIIQFLDTALGGRLMREVPGGGASVSAVDAFC